MTSSTSDSDRPTGQAAPIVEPTEISLIWEDMPEKEKQLLLPLILHVSEISRELESRKAYMDSKGDVDYSA